MFCVVKSLPWIILFTMQAFVSSGTNFTLQFPKGEDGTVPKDYLDFDREPGKVKEEIRQFLSWIWRRNRWKRANTFYQKVSFFKLIVINLQSCFGIEMFFFFDFPCSSILRQFNSKLETSQILGFSLKSRVGRRTQENYAFIENKLWYV